MDAVLIFIVLVFMGRLWGGGWRKLDGFKHARSFANEPRIRGFLKGAENNGRGAFAVAFASVQRDLHATGLPIGVRDELRAFLRGGNFGADLSRCLEGWGEVHSRDSRSGY